VQSQLFSSVLEDTLRAQTGRDVEVLNLSAVGLSLEQEINLLHARGWRLAPDVVVFAYCFNDPVPTEIGIGQWSDAPGSSVLLWLLRKAFDGHRDEDGSTWYDIHSDVYARLEKTFAELGDLSRQTRIAVAGLPLLEDRREPQPHLDALQRLTAKYGVPYIDLRRGMRQVPLERFAGRERQRDRIHYTAPAHRAVGEALAAALSKVVVSDVWPPTS
jgi:hypothetical protein